MIVRRSLPLIAVALILVACTGSRQGGQPLGGESSAAPDFPGGHTWFNVREPLTLAKLRGKVVVLDFWTLGCINCQQVIPDEKQLEAEFGDALVLIGVHSGKYDREHQDQSVREAIVRLGLDHPVVNDPEFDIWSSFGVHAWPTLVLIDPAGNVVLSRAGEGVYPAFQPAIKALVDEFGAKGQIDRTPIPIDLESSGRLSPVLSFPSGVLADDSGGRLFVSDTGHDRVLISGLDGGLQDVIGSGREGAGDGSFEGATFRGPHGLALSPDGNTLYVADTRNHLIRAADLITREVRTIAGTGSELTDLPDDDAPAIETALASPWGIIVVGDRLYVAMAGVHQIWEMDLAAATLSAIAGTGREGIDDGSRLAATLAQPSGLTTDGSSLFWVDPESSSVRRLPLEGEGRVQTIVGTGLFDFGDRDGGPGKARLQHPQGVAYFGGLLYVADTYNHKVRTVDPVTGEVMTVAGSGEAGLTDGAGAVALLSEPGAVAAGGSVVYVADTNNNVIRLLDPDSGTVSTLVLSNLRVALTGIEGRTVTDSIPGQTAGPGAGTLVVRLTSPAGYHLNSLAPSHVLLGSSNSHAIELSQEDLTFSSDEPSAEQSVPVNLRAGDAVLMAQGEVYYCRLGEEGICLVDNLDVGLPVTVSDGAAQNVITLDYTLPQVLTD